MTSEVLIKNLTLNFSRGGGGGVGGGLPPLPRLCTVLMVTTALRRMFNV